jgi:hypothetical protein
MSERFYIVLLFSLMITVGLVFLYYGIRYLRMKNKPQIPARKYVELGGIESGNTKGEIFFQLHIPEEINVKLEILDLSDNVLAVVEDKVFLPGTSKVCFNTQKLSDGEYFYRIETPHQQTLKKFIISNA